MSYVERNLNPGESVTYRGQIHWAVGLSFFIVGALFMAMGEGGTVIGLFLIAMGALRIVLTKITNEYAITSKRVISKQGLISRRTIELNLNRVESASIDQGITGRLLGYGTIRVRGTGQAEAKFKHLANPMEFRRALMHAIEPSTEGEEQQRAAS